MENWIENRVELTLGLVGHLQVTHHDGEINVDLNLPKDMTSESEHLCRGERQFTSHFRDHELRFTSVPASPSAFTASSSG